MTLKDLRRTAQIFCRMLLAWDLSGIFLLIRLKWWAWGWTTTEVKYPFHPITWRQHTTVTVDVYGTLWLGGISRLSCEVAFSCSRNCALWEEVISHSSQLWSGQLYILHLRGGEGHSPINYLKFCRWHLFVLPHLSIYIFNHLCISVGAAGYLFYSLGYNPPDRTGFLSLTLLTSGSDHSLFWGCPVHCRMFSSISDHQMPLENPPVVRPQNVPRYYHTFPGGEKSPLQVENINLDCSY